MSSTAYRQQYGSNAIFLLPANLYGPGDNFDLETSRVIPAVIGKCVEARCSRTQLMEAWGSGMSRASSSTSTIARKELYGLPPLMMAVLLLTVGTGREIRIGHLAQIARLPGYEGYIKWQKASLTCSRAASSTPRAPKRSF